MNEVAWQTPIYNAYLIDHLKQLGLNKFHLNGIRLYDKTACL